MIFEFFEGFDDMPLARELDGEETADDECMQIKVSTAGEIVMHYLLFSFF